MPGEANAAHPLIGRRVGNYRIEKLLGQGGMGAVYLLRHDTLPNTFIALKTLNASGEDGAGISHRFVQEAMIAAAIGTHRVARPLDLGRFDDGMPYILMEYVAGRTLADKLASDGALPAVVVLRIAWRVADTMAIAHARDIIHRDLKPSNIMLGADDGSQVKLLDFGVAQARGALKLADTRRAALIGSPGYMSPEAATGLPVDDRADVFSLGVTMWTMLTGELPWRPATDRASLDTLLEATLPPLRRPPARDEVPAELEQWMRRSLARDARQRPTMAELRDGLFAVLRNLSPNDAASLATTPPPSEPRAVDGLAETISYAAASPAALRAQLEQLTRDRIAVTRPSRRRYTRLLVAAMAVALAAAGLMVRLRHAPLPPLKPGERRSIAIAPLSASGGADASALSATVAQLVAEELRCEQLRVVPPERSAELGIDGNARAELRAAALGTQLVADGSCTLDGKRAHLALTLRDGNSGRAVGTVTVDGDAADAIALARDAAQRLQQQLGIAPIAAPGSFASPAAAQAYEAGMAARRRGDTTAARDAFARAVAAEPTHALAHARLAEAWSILGDDERAQSESQRAIDLAHDLSREQRLLVEAVAHEAVEAWHAAADSYSALYRFFPDDIEYGLSLANAQRRDGRPKDALTTIDSLRKLADDPRAGVIESKAACDAGDLKRCRGSAEHALQLADSRHLTIAAATARLALAQALINAGELAAATKQIDAADAVFAHSDNRKMQSIVLNARGMAAYFAGDTKAARAALEQEIQLVRAMGDHNGLAHCLGNLATLVDDEGDHRRAVELYREELELLQHDLVARAQALTSLGAAYKMLGRYDEGIEAHREALTLARKLGNDSLTAEILSNLSATLEEKGGDLDRALELRQEALALARKGDDRETQVHILAGLGGVERARGDHAAALRTFAECETIATEIASQRWSAECVKRRAAVLESDGRAAEAEALAAKAARMFHEQKLPDAESEAMTTLALAQLAQHRRPEAMRTIDAAVQLAATDATATAYDVRKVAALVRASSGSAEDVAQALSALDEELARAQAAHASTERLIDLGVARAAVAWRYQKSSAALSQLASLARQARQVGLVDGARNAEAARRR